MARKDRTKKKKSRSWLSGRSRHTGQRLRSRYALADLPMLHGTAGPAAQVAATLEQAGYDPTDIRSFERGMAAFMAAQTVAMAAQEGEDGVSAGPAPGPIGGVTPEMIPLLETDAVMKDLAWLRQIFLEDPELKRVRFDAERATARLLEVQDERPEGAEEVAFWLDCIAAEFAADSANRPMVEGLTERLLQAAPRWRERPCGLRPLVAGYMLATMAKTDDGPNPLTAMLFRLSVDDALDHIEAQKRLFESAGVDIDQAKETCAEDAAGKAVPPNGPFGAFSRLPKKDQKKLHRFAERLIEKMRKQIIGEDFQMHLPIACVIGPVLAQLELMRQHPGLAPDDERFEAVVEQLRELVKMSALRELHPEDRRLYLEACEHWLATEASAYPKQVSLVQTLCRMVASESLWTVEDALILVTLSRMRFLAVPGEPMLNFDSLEPDAGELERYGDFLVERGYPTLALRFYQAIKAMHPPSPELTAKIADLVAHS